MTLKKEFESAEKRLKKSDLPTLEEMRACALSLQKAEAQLVGKADGLMKKCLTGCAGMCCKNVQIDLVIHAWDFVFILLAAPHLDESLKKNIQNEDPMFSSDCVFLKDGEGPCILPDDIRPSVCVTTFCDDVTPIKAEIKAVRRLFGALARIYWKGRIKNGFSRLINYDK